MGIKEEYDLTESEIVTSASTLCSKVYEVSDDSSDDERYDMPEEVHKLHCPIKKINKYERDPTGTSIVRNTCQGRRSLGEESLPHLGGGGAKI